LDLVVGKATDTFHLWQQIPAWVLGAAAITGGGFLIAFPNHLNPAQSRDAWVAVIIALFLAVLLSYRSAFTLDEGAPGSGTGTPPANKDAPPPAGGDGTAATGKTGGNA
jgi:hypothetical protein